MPIYAIHESGPYDSESHIAELLQYRPTKEWMVRFLHRKWVIHHTGSPRNIPAGKLLKAPIGASDRISELNRAHYILYANGFIWHYRVQALRITNNKPKGE